jgi:hypothetical protein
MGLLCHSDECQRLLANLTGISTSQKPSAESLGRVRQLSGFQPGGRQNDDAVVAQILVSLL